MRRRAFLAGSVAGAALPGAARAANREAPTSRPVGTLELAALVDAPSNPTGVAVSREGRIFVMMPRFTAAVPFTLGEVLPDGAVRPYPDAAANEPDRARARTALFHVPNGVFDREDHLWVLDAALPEGRGAPVSNGAKLVQYDIAQNRVLRTVPLDAGVAPDSSLNDLRLGVRDGREVAFVTDQGQEGRGAILAIDLADGRVTRRLAGHPSTTSGIGVVKYVEARPVLLSKDGSAPKGGANGVALSPDARRLYYCPLMSRRLYAVDTTALLDSTVADEALMVEDLGEKGLTGGLLADAKDRIYLALQEQNAIGRRDPDGSLTTLASDPRLIWADTFWITPDRWLYVSAAQVNRRPEYNGGRDLSAPPYAILRMRIDADPA